MKGDLGEGAEVIVTAEAGAGGGGAGNAAEEACQLAGLAKGDVFFGDDRAHKVDLVEGEAVAE